MKIVVRGAPNLPQYRKKPNENEFLSVVNSVNEPVFSSGNIQTLINEAESRVVKYEIFRKNCRKIWKCTK